MNTQQGSGRRIRVLVADDHNVVRAGLHMLLECESGIELVGEAASGREAIDLAVRLCPDVVLMDMAMMQLNGVEATRRILQQCPRSRVIAFSTYGDLELVRKALSAGASGYLLKHTSYEDLVQAVREVSEGHAHFSPQIARELCQTLKRSEVDENNGVEPQLTSREAEVLQLVAEGEPSKAIASDLGLSIKTVEKHRQRLMRKLNIHNTADLVRYAAGKHMIETRPKLDGT